MKTVILAGGLGTRLSEETQIKPKPMVEVGGKPILWHIMKIYSAYNITDFIVCLGYKGYVIKEYFANYFLHMSDVTFDMKNNQMEVHQQHAEPWKVTLVDTGESTQTGGRIKRVQKYVGKETFCCTYGDGIGDVNIADLLACHHTKKVHATLTAIQPPGRYGALDIRDGLINNFKEKPHGDGGWINGGFSVLEPAIFDFIDNDTSSWEIDVLPRIAKANQLAAYVHRGFWQAMDTVRDKRLLDELWESKNAPWKTWS